MEAVLAVPRASPGETSRSDRRVKIKCPNSRFELAPQPYPALIIAASKGPRRRERREPTSFRGIAELEVLTQKPPVAFTLGLFQ